MHGVGEVRPGDDLAALLVTALRTSAVPLRDGDVLVVSSKVVSKADGHVHPGGSRDEAIAASTVRVVAERTTPAGTARIVVSRAGPVLAAAGVDASNVAPGQVLTLPPDPDGAARRLLAGVTALTGHRIGVVISDTAGRPWRLGQVDIAVGAAGIDVTDDLRGAVDGYGNPLEVTVRALADEIAALADLVKGKLDGVPAAVVRGLDRLVSGPDEGTGTARSTEGTETARSTEGTETARSTEGTETAEGTGAAALVRRPEEDWFRYGHVEAVRAALGVPPGTRGVPPRPVVAGDAADRLRRAVTVALAGGDARGGGGRCRIEVLPDAVALLRIAPRTGTAECATLDTSTRPEVPTGPDGAVELGMLAQRLLVAAWAEGLTATATLTPGPPPSVRVVATVDGSTG